MSMMVSGASYRFEWSRIKLLLMQLIIRKLSTIPIELPIARGRRDNLSDPFLAHPLWLEGPKGISKRISREFPTKI